MVKPAIVAVGYNRPEGMKRLLDSIGRASFQCDDVPLIISIDESNKSDEVEKVAREFEWEHGTKEIRRFPERQGLRKHIVQCGDYSEQYGGVIILEDDLVVAEDFYSYVCSAHETYGDDERVCGVSLYSFRSNQFTHYSFDPMRIPSDVFLGGMVVTWGQSWNVRQWRNFRNWYYQHEDKLPVLNKDIPQDISSWTRSWGRYFASFMADQHLFYVYPYIARTTCFSDFGEHNKNSIPFTFVQVPLMHGQPSNYEMLPIEQLVKYDCFYDRILDGNICIFGISGSDICLDINNMKTITDKKYVITNSKLDLEQVTTFGMTLRPASLNVIEEIPGNQLILYKMKEDSNQIRPWGKKRPNYHFNFRRLKYEYSDAPWRQLIYYGPFEFLSRLKDVLVSK